MLDPVAVAAAPAPHHFLPSSVLLGTHPRYTCVPEEPEAHHLQQELLFHPVVEPSSPVHSHEETIRVVSYNVLAESLALRHHPLYAHVTPAQLSWCQRVDSLVEQLRVTRADFYCLQEVDNYEQLKGRLAPLGYRSVFKKRTSEKNLDGCAIFWKAARFQLLESHPIEFNHQHSEEEDFDNVALCSLFSLTANPNRLLCVVSTHFLFNPQRGDLKLGQAQYLLSAAEDVVEQARLRYPMAQVSMVMAGDMNSAPYSGIWELFCKGELSLDLADLPSWCSSISGQRLPRKRLHKAPKEIHIDESTHSMMKLDVETDAEKVCFSHQFHLASAYGNYNELHEKLHNSPMQQPSRPVFPSGSYGEPRVTAIVNGSKNAVDSIWFTRNSLRLHKLLGLPQQNDLLRSKSSLPSPAHPSDHFMVGAEFVLSS